MSALFTVIALIPLVVLIVRWRVRYQSASWYRRRIGQPRKMDEMRTERWDAIEDANAHQDHDGPEQQQ